MSPTPAPARLSCLLGPEGLLWALPAPGSSTRRFLIGTGMPAEHSVKTRQTAWIMSVTGRLSSMMCADSSLSLTRETLRSCSVAPAGWMLSYTNNGRMQNTGSVDAKGFEQCSRLDSIDRREGIPRIPR